jgi:hypothetical protein
MKLLLLLIISNDVEHIRRKQIKWLGEELRLSQMLSFSYTEYMKLYQYIKEDTYSHTYRVKSYYWTSKLLVIKEIYS